MKTIDVISVVLLVVGGLNWGLVGLFDFDLVATILGAMSPIARLVYILVGLSAIWFAFQWKAMERRWAIPGHT